MNKTLSFIFVCVLAVSAHSQTPSVQISPPLSEASPESVGMSEERLARIDRMIQQSIGNQEIPGGVALVARDGMIVYHKAFGTADHETNRPFITDDIFRIASQSKAITATAVMMLWEEGKFRLDDPVSTYIPAFKDAQVLDTFNPDDTTYTTVPSEKPITIRHLLTHTSGIGYGIIDNKDFSKIYQKAGVVDLFTTEAMTIEESVLRLAKLPLHFNPGEKYKYSEGLDVLGYLVEILSGMPLDAFFKERIFDPLGMEDTYFYLPEAKADRLVPVQMKKEGKWTRYTGTGYYDPEYPVRGAMTFFSGGAGLSSTAKDYASFLQMYLNGGELNGVRLLSRTTVQFIMANQIGDLWGEDPDAYYGLAFRVITPNGEGMGGRGSVGTFSWGGYFNTQYFADPQEQVIGVIMKQTRKSGPDPTGWKFQQLVGQAVDD